jgi:hypothetical protein
MFSKRRPSLDFPNKIPHPFIFFPSCHLIPLT